MTHSFPSITIDHDTDLNTVRVIADYDGDQHFFAVTVRSEGVSVMGRNMHCESDGIGTEVYITSDPKRYLGQLRWTPLLDRAAEFTHAAHFGSFILYHGLDNYFIGESSRGEDPTVILSKRGAEFPRLIAEAMLYRIISKE